MKILKKSGQSWRFKLQRSRPNRSLEAGAVIEISAGTVEGRQDFGELGGLTNLEPLDVPERAEYICCIKIEKPIAGGASVFSAGSVVSFEKEEAIRLMMNAGSIRPVSSEVCDLGAFLPFRYGLTDQYRYTSKPEHLQRKDRETDLAMEREREKARQQVAEELGHTKKFKISKW
jgi:hypothetical protein